MMFVVVCFLVGAVCGGVTVAVLNRQAASRRRSDGPPPPGVAQAVAGVVIVGGALALIWESVAIGVHIERRRPLVSDADDYAGRARWVQEHRAAALGVMVVLGLAFFAFLGWVLWFMAKDEVQRGNAPGPAWPMTFFVSLVVVAEIVGGAYSYWITGVTDGSLTAEPSP